jgi:hypothetical protein
VTFKQLVDDTLDRLNYDSTAVTSAPRTRIGRLINIWHRRILGDSKYAHLRDDSITFASVAAQARYGLPPSIMRINAIYETTNNNRLVMRDMSWYLADPQGLAQQAVPTVWVPKGLSAVIQQPATTGLWAASSSASDTTQKVNADVIRTGGYIQTLTQATLTGTTRVAITSTVTDIIDVLKFNVSAACLGSVSLYDAAVAGNEIARIPVGRTTSRYFTIYLWGTPSSAITYTVECRRQIQDLVLDIDEPMLPEDFHWILSACARYEEILIKKDFPAARIIMLEEIKPALATMCGAVSNPDDLVVIPGEGDDARRGSNLGSWYPAGRW